jgi:NAD(P)-dependent dehydrogenase (short-subunit alcohol dehydrogenase family)
MEKISRYKWRAQSFPWNCSHIIPSALVTHPETLQNYNLTDMAQVILITGASTGFGALMARSLAKSSAKNIVYAGMYSHGGDVQQYEDEITSFNQEHSTDLRTVPLDLLSQDSCDNAVKQVLSTTGGKLDVVIHNAGHMNYGPAEAFTAEQYLRLYDVNVVGTQRLNQAVLPHMRQQRSGHIIWISSSSVYGGKSPMLGGYFAAKAAMDSLAQTYARELHPWGIETTIVVPGVFTKGTNHFADAMQPGRSSVANEYNEGPTGWIVEQTMVGTAGVVPEDADPQIVADEVVKATEAPRGSKPYRLYADAANDGCEIGASVIDRLGNEFYRRFGLEKLLKVSI